VENEHDDRESDQGGGEGDHPRWERWCRQVRDVVVTATPPLVALANLVHELRELLT
jgi:hypothetical protein